MRETIASQRAEEGDIRGTTDDIASGLKQKFEEEQHQLSQNHANKIQKLELEFRAKIENLTNELNQKQEIVDELMHVYKFS